MIKKMVKINQNVILSLITGVIFLVILLGISSSLIPTAATAYHNFSDAMAEQSEVVGTDAATFAGNTDNYLGWLWVAMPFLMVLGLIIGLFVIKRGRR